MQKDLKIFTDSIEQEAIEQINLLLDQETFKDSKIRIMPDVHAGKGCVIGFTGNLGNKVIPNIVGVDIGCGMLCIELGNIELDLEKLDNIIREYVPSGFNVHDITMEDFDLTSLKCYKELKNIDHLRKSLGTLGGGNHFIEIDIDEDNNKYLIIHTGSRNLGKQVAEIYQNKAIKYCSYEKELQEEIDMTIKYHKENNLEKGISAAINKIKEKYIDKTKLPRDLCYLENSLKEDYLHDMKKCQEFAWENRMVIGEEIMFNYFGRGYTEISFIQGVWTNFQTIHNYISFEDNIVRKGAISAQKGEKVLIPMNMRDGCIIGIGKGNNDWNQSAPHGAGRIMSRIQAKKTFKLEEFQESMKNIYTTSVSKETLDEAPFVYKPMQEIIDNIGDTVDILKIIKPIYNFKASE